MKYKKQLVATVTAVIVAFVAHRGLDVDAEIVAMLVGAGLGLALEVLRRQGKRKKQP